MVCAGPIAADRTIVGAVGDMTGRIEPPDDAADDRPFCGDGHIADAALKRAIGLIADTALRGRITVAYSVIAAVDRDVFDQSAFAGIAEELRRSDRNDGLAIAVEMVPGVQYGCSRRWGSGVAGLAVVDVDVGRQPGVICGIARVDLIGEPGELRRGADLVDAVGGRDGCFVRAVPGLVGLELNCDGRILAADGEGRFDLVVAGVVDDVCVRAVWQTVGEGTSQRWARRSHLHA